MEAIDNELKRFMHMLGNHILDNHPPPELTVERESEHLLSITFTKEEALAVIEESDQVVGRCLWTESLREHGLLDMAGHNATGQPLYRFTENAIEAMREAGPLHGNNEGTD